MKAKKCIIIEFDAEEVKTLKKVIKKAENNNKIWDEKIAEFEKYEPESEMLKDFRKYKRENDEKIDIFSTALEGKICDRNVWNNFRATIIDEYYGLESENMSMKNLVKSAKDLDFRSIKDDF